MMWFLFILSQFDETADSIVENRKIKENGMRRMRKKQKQKEQISGSVANLQLN
jgi:hypothetical protein